MREIFHRYFSEVGETYGIINDDDELILTVYCRKCGYRWICRGVADEHITKREVCALSEEVGKAFDEEFAAHEKGCLENDEVTV
tara:strand:+ start:253 stop:504 length:252 start_codon:yes stop_codon:yes gene_type:complete